MKIVKILLLILGFFLLFLTVKTVTGRGLLLKFDTGKELILGHSSKQVHVKIDLNYFTAPKRVTERRPVNHGQLSFVCDEPGPSRAEPLHCTISK